MRILSKNKYDIEVVVLAVTLRGMLSSQSGKLITLVALPTQSTTTVANICMHIQQNIREMLAIFSHVKCSLQSSA